MTDATAGSGAGSGALETLRTRSAEAMAWLDPEQREAAAIDEGQALVVAPAGSGKTAMLTARIVRLIGEGIAKPDEVMGVTFTVKAAKEFRDRIAAALGRASAPRGVATFHSFGAAMLRAEPAMAGLKPDFAVADPDRTREIVRRALAKRGLRARKASRFAADPVKAVADRLSRMKDDGFLPEESAAWLAARTGQGLDDEAARDAAEIAADVQKSLRRANLADFGDLLLWPTRAMRADEALRRRFAGKWRFITVDEYQDANLVQHEWLRLLARDHGNVVAVADDDQCLYEWRGARPEHVARFEADWPGARIAHLSRNYRSSAEIVAAASRLIGHNADRREKSMTAADGPCGVPVSARETRDPADEAAQVVRAIVTRPAHVPLDACAVLYRAAYMGRAVEDALREAGVKYGVVGDQSFYRRKEILDAVAFLGLAEGAYEPASDESFLRVVNLPPRGVGEALTSRLREAADRDGISLFAAAERMVEAEPEGKDAAALAPLVAAVADARIGEGRPEEMLDAMLDGVGYRAMLAADSGRGAERLANLAELRALAERFGDCYGLTEHCAMAAKDADAAGEYGKVKMMTIHAAKGLEFERVHLVGWGEGLFPTARSDKEERMEEERRLAYVAITRARSFCEITWPRAVGKVRAVGPSRFIAEAGVEPLRLDEAYEPPRRRSRFRRRGSAWRSAGKRAGAAVRDGFEKGWPDPDVRSMR